MITRRDIINKEYGSEDMLLFDIETTGLSPKSAQVYLIGCISREDGRWVHMQWFAENLADEDRILDAFASYVQVPAEAPRHLATFNGTTFDIPFLESKFRKYDISSPFTDLEHTDIYRMISPLKNILKLPNCRQKTLEEYLGLHRADPFTGGQLIELYKEYRSRPDQRLLEVLLLHNAEDLTGMLEVMPALAYSSLFTHQFTVTGCSTGEYSDLHGCRQQELLLELKLDTELPVPIALNGDGCFFTAGGDSAMLKVTIYTGELKYFYPDYKNYSYLPEEDRAMHKSVAIYVDKNHRVPATPATCYIKKSGNFLPLPLNAVKSQAFSPVLKKDTKDKESYLPVEDAFLSNNKLLTLYAGHLLDSLRK